LAERQQSPVLRIGFVVAMIGLWLGAIETFMRYENWPRPVISGWRATAATGPVNQFGWRGQPPRRHDRNDFVVVLTGGGDVECIACPPDETMDVILERALRQYNPSARVITLGSRGYAQDQEYLALHEYFVRENADLVVNWAEVATDVPRNTFRAIQTQPGRLAVKPSFALYGNVVRGPTEMLGQAVYRSKISGLVRPFFIDIDRNWTTLLPRADPGASNAADGVEVLFHVDEPLEQQRSTWSIWLTPRPARVQYGIDLTHGLLGHMKDLAVLRGARFAVLVTPSQTDVETAAPVAVEHSGHWFVADPSTRDAAIAEVTAGFETITLPPDSGATVSPAAERRLMARLAEVLNEKGMLAPPALARARH